MNKISVGLIAFGVVSFGVNATVENSTVNNFEVKKLTPPLEKVVSKGGKEVSETSTLKLGLPIKNNFIAQAVSTSQNISVSKNVIVPVIKNEEPTVYKNGNFLRYEKSGLVEFKVTEGTLKPQIFELLLNHDHIDGADDIQWMVSNNFMWPNNYTLKGQSIDHILNDLLNPYRIAAHFKGNGTVVLEKI